VLGGVNEPIRQLLAATCSAGVEQASLELVHLRASQITGCSWCVSYGARNMRPSPLGRLVGLAPGHKKIILYANPGTEAFYGTLGFLRISTAMAIWHDPSSAIEFGLLSPGP